MFWRPSTHPPRLSRWLLSLLTPARSRRFLLEDLQEEFEQILDTRGRAFACSFYRRQAGASVVPLLRSIVARLAIGRPSRVADRHAVSVGWRPAGIFLHDPTMHGAPMLDLRNDLRQAVRVCFRQPLPTLMVILSLGVGIGGSTALYSFGSTLLGGAEPLPGVVDVYTGEDAGRLDGRSSAPDYRDVAEHVDALASTAMFRIGSVELSNPGGERRPLLVELVAGDFFGISALRPARGRLPQAAELPLSGAEAIVVIGFDLWRQQLGADPDVVGSNLLINGRSYTVVGVGPEGYASRLMGLRVDAWLPIGIPGGIHTISEKSLADRSARDFQVLGQLRPEASLARARAQLHQLSGRLVAQYPDAWKTAEGKSLQFNVLADDGSRLPPEGRSAITALFGIVGLISGLVLLIACSNAAGLALARGESRRREMAVRLSMGASRFRIVRLLLLESAIPALAAGGLGLFFAHGLISLFERPALPIDLPIGFAVEQDGSTLLFALGLSLLATIVFGLAPALDSARSDLVSSLKADATGGSGRGLSLRRVLIAGQVALAVIFVVTAAVLVRGAYGLDLSSLGYRFERAAVMSRSVNRSELDADGRRALLEEMRQRLVARPEIAAAELSTNLEGSFMAGESVLKVSSKTGSSEGGASGVEVAFNAVSDGYLKALGIHLLQGRGLESRAGAEDVAVVTRSFVERLWPGESGVGRTFRAEDPERPNAPARVLEVIGVAGDGAYAQVGDTRAPFFWMPFDPERDRLLMVLAVGNQSADGALAALRDEVELLPGEVTLIAPRRYPELIEASVANARTTSHWLGVVGLLGLLLALVGIYGLVAYIVSLRHRELAIRQAMGATPRELVLTVARGGLTLAVVGFGVGLPLALLLASLIGKTLPGSAVFDPLAIIASAVLVGAATLWASVWPARRAAALPSISLLGDR